MIMNTCYPKMNINAFVSNAGPLLRSAKRPFPMSSFNWLCSISPREGGRGAWDLDQTPNRSDQAPNRSYTRRPSRHTPPSRDQDEQGGPRRSPRGGHPGRGREFPDRGQERDTGYPEERRASYREREQADGQRGERQGFNRDSYQYHARGRREDYNAGQTQWSGRRDSRQQGYIENEEPSVVQRALAAEDDDLLYGVTPVLLALLAGRRTRFEALYVQEGRGASRASDVAGPAKKADNDAAFERVMTMATGKQIEIIRLDKGDLNMLSRNRPHQGLVLQTSKLEYEDLKALPKVDAETVNSRGVPPCYLVLDEVTDPQNAGALLRSAHFLGADGVIACRRNSCRLSPVVSKASAGALEMMRVQGVSSMPRFLKTASQDGWQVIGTALTKDAVNAKSITLDRPTLVVMGSEGHGLRTMVRNACDMLVRIEGSRDEDIARDLGLASNPVDSLNVSVAGALALYQLLGR